MNKRVSLVVIACAIVAGLVAWGVYAMRGGGNVGDEVACMMDDATRAALDGAVGGEVAAFQIADRPASLSSLAFADADGAPVTFDAFSGKTVLFNLWATWCVPCRVEMPYLDTLQAELGGDAFQVVPVSVDLGSAEKPKAFYAEIGLQNLPFYHDGDIATLDTLKKAGIAFGLPATVLADGEGCVLGWLNGPAEWAGDDAKRLVRAAIK